MYNCLIIINSSSHAGSAQLQLQVSNVRMQSDDDHDSGNDSFDVSHVRDVGIIIDVSYELHRHIREALLVPPYVGMNDKTQWRLHTMYYSQTLIFRLVMNFIRPKTLRPALWRCPILQ